MDYKKLAQNILQLVGGKENISHIEHCSTRLRLTLIDNSKVKEKQLQEQTGVLGVVLNVQCQIIIGNDVVEVFDELRKLIGDIKNTPGKQGKQKIGSVVLDFIISVFQPLVPAIAGGGILKSMLLLFSMLGWLSDKSPTYQVLSFIGEAPIYFLPILVAITTANKLKVNTLVAVSAVGTLLLPNMMTAIGEGITLFGTTVPNIGYATQVFPPILCVLFYALMEKVFTKFSPKAIRIFFVPMMSLVITVPVTLLILGPLGFQAGQALTTAIVFLFEKFGWIAVALLAAILPFMVAAGMHKALTPYAISSMTDLGKDLLYLPASLAHNIAESGACFAVAIRSKNPETKSTAISAGISALFGITEPALYGITLLNKRVLYSVMLGGLIGGAYVGLTSIAAFVPVGPGLASLTMFISQDAPSNIKNAIIAFVISFVAAFIATFILYKEATEKNEEITSSDVDIFNSPIIGQVVPLSEVKDEVFSNRIMGDGIAIVPEEGILYAPTDGTVKMIFDTNHALGIETKNGAEILFHIGLDTVQLSGQFFHPIVKVGDKIVAGEKLIEFDLEKIKEAGYDPTTIAVITNKNDYQVHHIETDSYVNIEQTMMTISEIGAE